MKFSQVPANSGISREYVMIGKVGDTFRHEEILLYRAGNGGYSYSFSNMGGSGGIYYFRSNYDIFTEYTRAQDAQGFGCGGGGSKTVTNPSGNTLPTAAGSGSPGMEMLRW